MVDLRSGIIETANSLGMSPRILATIISFESGFNANAWGGAGGNHYGLIQFGPRERQEFGVRIGDPSSQLGANGAIARYFRKRGWRQGMSMLDAYSIVNAGGPGLYSRSDTASGGTQGDVYDKVTQQMGPHWQRAGQLLGGANYQDATMQQETAPTSPLRHVGGAGSGNEYFRSNPAGGSRRHVGGAGSGPEYFTSPESTDGGGFDPVGDPTIFPREDTGGQPSDLAEALGKGVTGDTSGDSGGLFPGYGNQNFDLQYQSAYPNLQPAEADVSPLAKLFNVGNIGQADMLAQQSGIRRNYG